MKTEEKTGIDWVKVFIVIGGFTLMWIAYNVYVYVDAKHLEQVLSQPIQRYYMPLVYKIPFFGSVLGAFITGVVIKIKKWIYYRSLEVN